MNKKTKVQSLTLKSRLVRSIRSFFYNKIFPHAAKFGGLFILLSILIICGLVFLKKDYLSRTKNSASRFIFKSLGLNNEDNYIKINIFGNRYSDYEQIESLAREEITKSSAKNGLFINSIKKKIEKLPWVEEVIVSRNLPNLLNITIKEYDPFAIWDDGEAKYVINKDGKIIKVNDIEDFYYLVILSGKGANLNAKSLFNILTIDPQISKNVYSAFWIGGRRWDIQFENGLLVKLPESDIGGAWNKLIKIYKMSDSTIGLRVVDLRIDKKIYLEYSDKTTKELKSL